ncbi:hypothetical protein KCU90_g5, partial [Aureobasidium melanogenum]
MCLRLPVATIYKTMSTSDRRYHQIMGVATIILYATVAFLLSSFIRLSTSNAAHNRKSAPDTTEKSLPQVCYRSCV